MQRRESREVSMWALPIAAGAAVCFATTTNGAVLLVAATRAYMDALDVGVRWADRHHWLPHE